MKLRVVSINGGRLYQSATDTVAAAHFRPVDCHSIVYAVLFIRQWRRYTRGDCFLFGMGFLLTDIILVAN
ncbi:hypothetical protein KRR40_19625 [Niabella defluvii]|nr:hypothetical protein KRR40_19625 [Niabella sp. I65]